MLALGDKVRNTVSRSKLPVGTVGIIVPIPAEYVSKSWATNGVVWVLWENAPTPNWIPIQDLEVVK